MHIRGPECGARQRRVQRSSPIDLMLAGKDTTTDRICALLQAMADNQFWEEGDVALMKAWVQDLQAVGYKFPKPRREPKPASMVPVEVAHPTPKHWYGARALVPCKSPECCLYGLTEPSPSHLTLFKEISTRSQKVNPISGLTLPCIVTRYCPRHYALRLHICAHVTVAAPLVAAAGCRCCCMLSSWYQAARLPTVKCLSSSIWNAHRDNAMVP